ncbi:hypothetical protein ScalyP_jg5957, partial [Parmales sp. scaly parma]
VGKRPTPENPAPYDVRCKVFVGCYRFEQVEGSEECRPCADARVAAGGGRLSTRAHPAPLEVRCKGVGCWREAKKGKGECQKCGAERVAAKKNGGMVLIMGKCKGVGGVPCSRNERSKGKGECYKCAAERVAAKKAANGGMVLIMGKCKGVGCSLKEAKKGKGECQKCGAERVAAEGGRLSTRARPAPLEVRCKVVGAGAKEGEGGMPFVCGCEGGCWGGEGGGEGGGEWDGEVQGCGCGWCSVLPE